MVEETKPFVKGYETNTITTFERFKGLMIDLLKGYPEYEYFGKFESTFTRTGKKVVEILSKDNVIEISPKVEGEPVMYRLTPLGINLAISMINLEHSERVLKYSKNMKKLTIWIIVLSILTLGLGLVQLFIKLPIIDILSFFR